MVRLYKELGETGISMTFDCMNEYQMLQVTFTKGPIHRHYVLSYEANTTGELLEKSLLDRLHEFEFIYEQDSIKMNRAMDLRKYMRKDQPRK